MITRHLDLEWMVLEFVHQIICVGALVLDIIMDNIRVIIINFMDGVIGVGHQDDVVVGVIGQKDIFVHGHISLVVDLMRVLVSLIYVFSSGVNVHTLNHVVYVR